MFRLFAVSMCLASLVGCASQKPDPSVTPVKPPATAAVDCESREPELGSMVKRRKCVAVASAEEKAQRKEAYKEALDRALNAEPVGR
ncbi:hypothetical protein CDL60_06155 [Roseateles noduli]|nr:hypothetical protein CDL60_06155 [Roseateles noduli]